MADGQNSSAFATLSESIDHSAENKLTLSNVSLKVNVNNTMIMDEQNIFKNYEDVIFQNLITMDLPKEFHYKPEYLSNDVYNTPDLWYLVLWVNRMSTFHEFTKPTINVFDPSKLVILNKIIEREKMKILESRENPLFIEDLVLKKIVV